jgi:DNA-binding MarR family transcriptional regulator
VAVPLCQGFLPAPRDLLARSRGILAVGVDVVDQVQERGGRSVAEEETRASDVRAGQVDAVVEATRVIGALIARTLVQLEPPVTMPQWRVLVLASDDGCPVSAIADDLAIHPSNATRIVERLASAGLLAKRRGTADRRQVLVTLTAEGRGLYDRAMQVRRDRVQEAMQGMTPDERDQLVTALDAFAEGLLPTQAGPRSGA